MLDNYRVSLVLKFGKRVLIFFLDHESDWIS